MKYITRIILMASATSLFTNCERNSSVSNEAHSHNVSNKSLKNKLLDSKEQTYSWSNADNGAGCIPRMAAMMRWYSADSLHNYNFIVDSDVKGIYSLNKKEVSRYLDKIHESGYFSHEYITAQQVFFKQLADNIKKTGQMGGLPEGLDADLVFPVSDFADMMELKDSFLFSSSKDNKSVKFDSGEAIQMIIFDDSCKIERITWESRSPQID